MSEISNSTLPVFPKSWGRNWLMNSLTKLLKDISAGRLTLILPDGEAMQFSGANETELHAIVSLANYKPLSALFLKGELAFAECYLNGDWDSPSLTDLFRFAMANEAALSIEGKGNFLTRILNRLGHLRNANTKTGSKKNIAYHYDLGNEFYDKWLDPSMTYSSALFEKGNESLEEAQWLKYHRIAEMAELQAGDKVLEIGCGWGGFSQVAAAEYNCNIHGVTLSEEQLKFARRRYFREQVADMATASLTDYRDTEGQYDKVVSIEMFEAVGYENWPTYFKTIQDRLKPGGVALLQVILIEDDRFESYKDSVDFIQKYIFPGGLLPSRIALKQAIEDHGLILEQDQLFGQDYAKTCQLWQQKFQHEWEEIKASGFDDRFKRMWEYYLSYCEAGFETGSIDVGFFKIRKPA